MASRDDPRPRARKAAGAAKRAGRPDRKPGGAPAGGAARKATGARKTTGAARKTTGAARKPGGAYKAGGAARKTTGAARKPGGAYKAGGASKAGGARKPSGRYERAEEERPRRGSSTTGKPAPRRSAGRDRDRPVDPEKEAGRARVERARKAGWGGVARRGARDVAPRKDGKPTASSAWRAAVEGASTRPAWQPEAWVREDDVRDEAERAVDRGAHPQQTGPVTSADERRRTRPPGGAAMADARDDLAKAVGDRQAAKYQQQLADAARAFERERYQDARRILRTLADRAPGSAAVRELHGLTLYRMGQWRAAAKELEAFRTLTGSTEQHPVLADSYRALGRFTEVDELWQELRAESPSGELVAEGRIVAAGALADQGRLEAAIRLIEQAKLEVKRPKPHHLRLWYAAADLHERAGDVPRARELFERIRRHEADFADVAERLSSL